MNKERWIVGKLLLSVQPELWALAPLSFSSITILADEI
jgi:hypothetical protein